MQCCQVLILLEHMAYECPSMHRALQAKYVDYVSIWETIQSNIYF